MAAGWLLERLASYGDQPAIVWRDRLFSYDDLVGWVRDESGTLDASGIGPGDVVTLEGDFSPSASSGGRRSLRTL